MLKISCILTSYNRPKRVREAIASVQTQTYPYWELIIVDDNSNLQTKQVLSEIVNADPRLRLIQSGVQDEDRYKTTRYASCINMAIPFITGDLVTYLTDDDIYFPERFEKMADVFANNPAIHVLYGRQKMVYHHQGKTVLMGFRPLIGVTRSPMRRVDHNSIMHRMVCLDIVNNWDDDPALWIEADAYFFKKLVKYWDFHPLDFVTDEHRYHQKGIQARLLHGIKPWENKDAED
jgi:glycosyltransferase involved in cell wall biosynthesis